MDETTKEQLESIRIKLVNSLDKPKALRTAAVNAAQVLWKITHGWGHASQQAVQADRLSACKCSKPTFYKYSGVYYCGECGLPPAA